MSWRRGTQLQVKDTFHEAGRDCISLGPDIEVFEGSVRWTPVRWEGEDDPDWFKTRGLEKRTPKKHDGHS